MNNRNPLTKEQGTPMSRKHLAAGAATLAVLAGGAAGAVAATNDDQAAGQSVLSDAAKRLGVSADDLRSALSSAEDAQLDAAVKAGTLTQAQADEIKAHRKADGTVLNLGHGGRGGHGHDGAGGRGLMDDAAKALGITTTNLFDQLRSGKTLAQVAKAKGKTPAEVKAAVKQSATDQLKADLAAKKITQSQYDDAISHLDDEIDELGTRGPGHGPGDRPGDKTP
jgi:hypothetical protein